MNKIFNKFVGIIFIVSICFLSCNQANKTSDNKKKDEEKPKALELKKLEIGSEKFTDLSLKKLLNASSVENDVEKVKVLAEADADVSITYTPTLDAEKNWSLEVGENTLSIKLKRGEETPVVYTINLVRKAKQQGELFNGITAIKTATAEHGTIFSKNFNEWRETLLKKEDEKKYCVIDSIYPEDYLGFIFILKEGLKIEKVEQKSMAATEWVKMYHTKEERVTQNTNTPYYVYYFAKYSFSKGYSEQASVKLTYKDGKSDEFIVKAKNGVITE